MANQERRSPFLAYSLAQAEAIDLFNSTARRSLRYLGANLLEETAAYSAPVARRRWCRWLLQAKNLHHDGVRETPQA